MQWMYCIAIILFIINSIICWGFLDCCYAAVQGVGDGVVNVAHMVRHPIDTAIDMAHGTWIIAGTHATRSAW